MLKYTDTRVVFREIPDEITLAINISNCPCHCKGCHSSYLADDVGWELSDEVFRKLIENNQGISCVCLMGGDSDPSRVKHLMALTKELFPNIKTAWYSGRDTLPTVVDLNIHNFDYIKLGPYIEELGPLDNPNSNQRLYKIIHPGESLIDITNRFWK